MSFSVVLLSGKVFHNLAEVEQFGRLLKGQGESGLELAALLFESLVVGVLEGNDLRLVFLLSLVELVVPVLVEVLILFDVSLLALLSLLLMSECHFLHLVLELLKLEFVNSVLGHLCLDEAAFLFASLSVFFHGSTI